jgi:hypothetical protein
VADSPLTKRLREKMREIRERGFDDLLESSTTSDVLNQALHGLQSGRKSLDGNIQRLFSSLGFATSDDLDSINRRLGKLRKRMTALLDDLD